MRKTLSEKETVAAFDFDGTISYCDTLIPFLWFVAGPLRWFGLLFTLIPDFICYVFKGYSRQQMKEKVLTKFLKGMLIEKVKQLGAAFAKGPLKRLLKPQAMERLRWHREQGHVCVLISASLDVYLSPWAKEEGFQFIITSSLDVDAAGLVTGKLSGANCRGAEKVRRLEEVVGPRSGYVLYAYGDSEGDQELLAAADYPYYRKMPLKGETS